MSSRMRRRITSAKREEIEKEQQLLDSTIVRPFETLEGLPISYNEPPYGHYEDIFKTPLTVKDSAVLYNSLIRSRNTYVYHAPMFKLHWVKQTAYAKKLAEMDKEKQKEILQDRENKRRFAKATTNSLEARLRTPVLSPEVNARDVMSKLCESSMTLGPHTMDVRIFIAKDARSDKSKAIAELSKIGGTEKRDAAEIKSEPKASSSNGPSGGEQSKSLHPSTPAEVGTKENSPVGKRLESAQIQNGTAIDSNTSAEIPDTKNSAYETQPVAETKSLPNPEPNIAEAKPQSEGAISTKPELTNNDLPGQTPESSLSRPVATGVSTPSARQDVDTSVSATDEIVTRPSDNSELIKTKSDEQKTSKPVTKNVSPASTQKVTNLPTKADESDTTSVPSPATSLSKGPNVQLGARPAPAPAPSRPPPTNLQSLDNTIMISNLNAIAKIDLSLNDLMKEVASGRASESQITRFKKYIERAKQMGPQPHHAELYFSRGLPLPPNFPRPYHSRPLIEKRPPPKPKVHNPMKLTAFQERYLHNATLVFEFLENPNVRYIIPQDSICEVLKPEFPPPADGEEGVEYNDVLLSHLWIHNIDEVEQYEKDKESYEEELKRREEEEEKKRKEEAEGKKEDATVPLGGARNLRTKKKAPPPRKKKQLVAPEPPHIKYTAFSFKIHNIPSRFIPIVCNSMKPLKQMQEHMEHILKTGTRVSTFYLWYQVDARLDEAFAENLRSCAVAEEKKMSGFVPPVEPKKRKPKENKNPKPKRSKENTPMDNGQAVANTSSNGVPQTQSTAVVETSAQASPMNSQKTPNPVINNIASSSPVKTETVS